MMRVEVNMSASFRGLVDQYAEETNKTMPQAYKDLMEVGLVVSDIDLKNFSHNVDLPENVQKVVELDDDKVEIVVKEEQ